MKKHYHRTRIKGSGDTLIVLDTLTNETKVISITSTKDRKEARQLHNLPEGFEGVCNKEPGKEYHQKIEDFVERLKKNKQD